MSNLAPSPEERNTSTSAGILADARLRRAASRARVCARLMAAGIVPRSVRAEHRLLADVETILANITRN